MNTDEFYELRQRHWRALDKLVKQAESGIQQLSPGDIQQLGQLYRAATSDLAFAQRDFPNHRITLFLNQLVGRAHTVVYRSQPLEYNRLMSFVASGFPGVFRETLPFTIAAMLLFFVPALLIGMLMYSVPDTARWLLPEAAQEQVEMMSNQELWVDIPVAQRPYSSALIMSNNIQVSILAFGGGVLVGLLTVWVLLYNGLLLGGILGLAFHYGVGWDLANFVIGHGVIELSVICMSGGAGLQIGWAIIRPGLLRRRDALGIAGRRAVRLLTGCLPLLVVAGIIEGFISPNESIAAPVKWAVGIGSGIVLYGYLLLAGRNRESRLERRTKAVLSPSAPGSD